MQLLHSPHHTRSRVELLAHVTALYYLDGCTQAVIANRLQLSRQKVCRLLGFAREAGMVRIDVRPPQGVLMTLESELEERFGLREVRVAALTGSESPRSVRQRIGVTAAADFVRTLRAEQLVGLVGAELLASMIDAVAPMSTSGVRVVQAVGWEHTTSEQRPLADLVRELAHRIEGCAVVLTVPSIVGSSAVKRQLEVRPAHRRGAPRARHAGHALRGDRDRRCVRGIGDRVSDHRWVTSRFDTSTTAAACSARSWTVTWWESPFSNCGARDMLWRSLTVQRTRPPIAAALRTGLIHGLITDELTARAIAAVASPSPGEGNHAMNRISRRQFLSSASLATASLAGLSRPGLLGFGAMASQRRGVRRRGNRARQGPRDCEIAT